MAWSNLSSNQFVSYTDAQTSGIPVKLTLPTSNQWMTKDNVTTYLNVNTSYLTSYTSNQFVPKSNIVAGVSGITVKFSNSEGGQVVDSNETVYSEKMPIIITNATTGTLTFSIRSECEPYLSGKRKFSVARIVNALKTIIFTATVTTNYQRTDSFTINAGDTLEILLYYTSLDGVFAADMYATITACTASSGQAVTIGSPDYFYVYAYYGV